MSRRRDATLATSSAAATLGIVFGLPRAWEWLCDHSDRFDSFDDWVYDRFEALCDLPTNLRRQLRRRASQFTSKADSLLEAVGR